MNKRRKPLLGVAILLIWALAMLQGWRVLQIEEAESFYRWIIATSDRFRIEKEIGESSTTLTEPGEESTDTTGKEDSRIEDARVLFERVKDKTEDLLPAFTPEEGEADDAGLSKLLLYVKYSHDLDILWNLAQGDALADERQSFLTDLKPRLKADVLYGSEANVSLANMFFGFRKMAANFVWLQVDRYWHEGALFRMVPLMRTTVALDPTFVDAYMLGAWHLAYNITAGLPETPESEKIFDPKAGRRIGQKESFYYYAADFLKDGIWNNPKDYRLYFDLGFRIYHEKLKDNEEAARYLKEAVRYRHDVWVPRTLYRILEYNGQYEEALRGWNDYLKRYPSNLVAPRFIARNEAHVVQDNAYKAFEAAKEARAAGRTAEAAELEEQAQALWNKTREKWAILAADDPYGAGQLIMMEAQDLRTKGMYYDAVALLDGARYESGELFIPISDMIIEIKEEGGIPLALSERMELERRAERKRYREADEAQRAPTSPSL